MSARVTCKTSRLPSKATEKKNKKKVTVREYDAFKYYRAGDISLKALLLERHPLQRPLAKSGSGEL